MKTPMAIQTQKTKTAPMRRLSAIARDVRNDWKKVSYAAEPYLSAMAKMESIDDMYFCDSGASVVAYFLSNAQSWRGGIARRIKLELRKMLPSGY